MNLRIRFVKFIAKKLGVDYFENPTILDDGKDQVYIWKVAEKDRRDFAQKINSAFRQHYGREPRALHVVVSAPEDIQDITMAEFRDNIKPYLEGD